MEVKEQEKLYASALEKISILEVVAQPEDVSTSCKEIVAILKKVGDYKDAEKLAAEYQKKAEETLKLSLEQKYGRAMAIKEHAENVKDYDRAIRAFKNLKDYRDAAQQVEECQTAKRSHIAKNNISLGIKLLVLVLAAVIIVIKVNSWLDQREQAKVESSKENEQENQITIDTANIGDEVLFGDHKWRVLDKDEESLTMIGIYSDTYEDWSGVVYNDSFDEVTWEDCSLRSWLNTEFLENSFSEEERDRILLTDVAAEDNAVYGTEGGNDTQDFVYLMSKAEVEQYSDFTEVMGLNWLLRTPGNEQKAVTFVSSEHIVRDYGCAVTDQMFIRPMIRVSLEQKVE